MTKEIYKKITQNRTFLDIAEITAEEKKKLLSYLEKKGFTHTTFYLRFFQKGFEQWEILGIKECKNQFLLLPDVAEALSSYVDEEDATALPGDKGYFYILAQGDDTSVFYNCLRKANSGLCNKFMKYMSDLGMSPATTIKRFNDNANWKDWEREGLANVLADYMKTCSE